jgi:hypothetical protein
MANKHLSRRPQNVTPILWYYEEKGGLNIVHEIRHEGNLVRTDQIKIPWRKIRKSMERKDRDL